MSTTFWAEEAHLVKPTRNEPLRFVTSLVKFRHVSMAEATRIEAERKAAAEAEEAARIEAERKAAEAEEAARIEAERKAAEKTEAARLEAKRKAAEAEEAARLEAKRKAAEEELKSPIAEKNRKKKIGHLLNEIQTQLDEDSYTWKPISVYLDIQRAANEGNANCRLTADGFLITTKDVSPSEELLLPPYEALNASEIKQDLKTTKENLGLFNNTLNQKLIFVKESEGGFWNVLYEINTNCERPAWRKGRGMGMYALKTIKVGTVFDWIFLRGEKNKVEPGKNEYDPDSRVARIYYPYPPED